jgi:hypothetical protein
VGINKIGGERENHDETRSGCGDHPAALTAALRFEQAMFSFIHGGIFLCGRSEPLAEYQENRCAKNEYEEEELVTNGWADDGHFLFAGGNPLRFTDFVKASNGELRGNKPEDDRGNAEEPVKRNLYGALEEEKADGDGGGKAEDGADPGLQTVAREFNSAKNQRKLNAFAQNHEKDEKEDAPAGRGSGALGVGVNFLLDVFAKMARNAVHPDDHRKDKDRGDEKEQSFKAVLVDVPMFKGNCYREAQRGGQAYSEPYEPHQMGAGRAGEIDKDDADDERSFDTFPKSD